MELLEELRIQRDTLQAKIVELEAHEKVLKAGYCEQNQVFESVFGVFRCAARRNVKIFEVYDMFMYLYHKHSNASIGGGTPIIGEERSTWFKDYKENYRDGV